ncbi:MAG TPA: ABC transporter permease subunit, partial [Candidatus Wallbacteria bacterium]|nr:ABC transporter permease subunit [Candidatus Wallbacteria bacterium]
YALSRYEFRGRALVDAALEIPLIVSPIALGALLLIFFRTSAGTYIQDNAATFVFEIKGIILAQFITSAGVAARMIKATFDEISPRYEMVARSLGASPLYSFATVTFPLARRGIIAATAVTFAKCVGEFGATMTLAGTMPMKTETLPVSIFLNLSSASIEGVAVLIILLITLGLAAILFAKKMGAVRHD